jgi:hypothetical protein
VLIRATYEDNVMPVLFGRNLTERQLRALVGDPQQIFGVRLLQYADGPERGVRTLAFDTGGGLKFEVLIDRCMDIGSMHYMGTPIGWQSSTGFRSPWLHEGGEEDGLGFLRSFSGFMNTCGLDHVLAPATETAARYGRPSGTRHNLHGRASYTPARLLGYGTRWEDEKCFLWAEGEIRQTAVAGENLHLVRRLEAEVGSNSVTICDRVTNRGFQSTPHMLLYHINLGWPLLDEGTEFRVQTSATSLVGSGVVGDESQFRFQSGPQVEFLERVYDHTAVPNAEGRVDVAIINRNFGWENGSSGLSFLLEYDHAALPGLLQWQRFEEGCYAVGIEPCTVRSGLRSEQEERGEVRWLDHNQSCDYQLKFSVVAGIRRPDDF